MKVPSSENYGPAGSGKGSASPVEPIAIVGIGARYPGAAEPKTLWENILTRRRQFRRFREERLPFADYHDPDPTATDKTYGTQAAFLDGFNFDWRGHRIPKSTFDSHDIVHWLALDVALAALADAGITPATPLERDKVGVVLGNTLTGEFGRSNSLRVRWPYVRRALAAAAEARKLPRSVVSALEDTMEDYYKSIFPAPNEDMLVGGLSNTIAGRIANYMDFHGGAYVVDGACASSIIAIATAANYLAQGDLDLGLAGGVDISLDTLEMIGFSKVGALTRGEMSVYDKAASGFIPGEGCGFIVMKRLSDARRDGDYVYAVLRGWGIASDGKGGMTAPDAYGQSLALRRAYERAGYSPATLDFIEGHGTGTTLGDRIELEGIVGAVDALGGAEPRQIGMTSFKSLVGHCKAAAGIGGVMKAILAVNQRVLPPTAGCRDPHPIFADRAQVLYPILSGEVRDPSATLRAGVSGMGFGGINSHVTLESGDAPSLKLISDFSSEALLASHQDSEVFVLSADSPTGLIASIDTLLPIAQQISYAELVDLAFKLAGEATSGSGYRAAVVAASPAELYAKLGELRNLLENTTPDSAIRHDPRRDIWFGQGAPRRLGFLFPGQGSQQLNMGRSVLARFPWAKSLLQEARDTWGTVSDEAIDGFIYRSPEKAATPEQLDAWKKSLARTEIAQPAIVLASLLWLERLRRVGITPTATTGHSLGELTAFHAAGAFGRQDVLALAGVRGQAMAQPADQAGCMASLRCGRETAERLLESADGYVVIANLNGPEQTIISGDRPAVEQAVARAQAQQIHGTLLNVSNAFHSQRVATAADYLRAHADLPDHPERETAKVISSKAGVATPTGTLREHFAEHILAQVDFIQAVQTISAETDMLVEVGPGGVLSGLAGSNVSEAIALPVESVAGQDRDFNRVLAASFAAGCNIDWNEVHAERLIRPFVDPAERQWLINPCERPFAPKELNPAPLSVGSSGLEQAIIERAGIDAAEAEWYLQQRADFLADVMAGVASADLRAQGLAGMDRPSAVTRAAVTPTPVVAASPAPVAQASAGGTISERVAAFIMDLIADRTGFPLDSIDVTMSMLDDLGLDSIKTAEVAGATARQFNVADKVDPTLFAKSTIQEVVKAIAAALGGSDSGGMSLVEIERLETSGGNHRPTWVRSFAMRCLPDAAAPHAEPGYWHGRSFVVLHEASEAQLASALLHELTASGARAQSMLYVEAAANVAKLGDQDITGFISILPRDAEPDLLDLERTRRIVHRLHTLTSLPLRQAGQAPHEIFFVQFGAGHFGHDHGMAHPESIGAMSFAASWHLERDDLRMRVIDTVPEIDGATLFDYLSREAGAAGPWAAAGYDAAGQRLIMRPEILPATGFKPLDIAWTTDDVVVVTGGGKGITAECALAFAQATGVKMALVGSSPAPAANVDPNQTAEVSATLERFRAAGLTARYYARDITDTDAVAELIARIKTELGNPTGLIHGAAVNQSRRLDHTPVDLAFSQIKPKLLGAINLLKALDSQTLKQVIGFTSIIGITGMAGNGWYGWSNELANLSLRRFQAVHPHVKIGTVAYSVWDEVGMGVKGGGLKALARMGIAGIPVREGLKRFMDLAFHDVGTQQLVVTARVGGVDTWHSEPFTPPKANRFIDEVLTYQPNIECISRTRLTAERDQFVVDHNFKGSLLFPTVFGLEAMAQAVAYITGVDTLERLVVRDITLERPIVVDPEKGLQIEVHAELLELGEDGRRVVRAGISTEHSSFIHDHFSAVYCLDEAPTVPARHELEATVLDLEPLADLYGTGLLFQGRRFQRLEEIRALSETHATTRSRIIDFSAVAAGPDSSDGPFILGDPYYRDVQLQSGQLTLPQEQGLPLEIKALHIIANRGRGGSAICTGDLTEKTETDVYADLMSYDADGELFEYIEGYHARIVDRVWTNPSVQDLLNPRERDQRILDMSFGDAAVAAGIGELPTLNLIYQEGLATMEKETRHRLEQDWVKQALERLPTAGSMQLAEYKLSWDHAGRPSFEGNPDELAVSISHDKQVGLVAVGRGAQGCDVAALGTGTDWVGALGSRGVPHLDELLRQGCVADEAGGILWSALEAAFKAGGDAAVAIQSVKYAKSHARVTVRDTSCLRQVLVVPLALTRGPRRIVAVVCASTPLDALGHEAALAPIQSIRKSGSVAEAAEPIRRQAESVIRNMGYDMDPMGVDGTVNVIRDHMTVSMYFPISMREASNLSKTVNYANYVQWFGRLREIAFQPLSARMVAQFATLQWGMVTNFTETRIFNEATFGEIVEALFWASQESESGIDTYAFWRARTPDGQYRPLGLTRQMSSWVAITGHGFVEPRPLPDYIVDFLDQIRAGDEVSRGGLSVAEITGQFDETLEGSVRFRAEVAPGKPGHPIFTETFQTDQTDSNVVGNIYFANYSVWQAKLVDRIVHRLAPDASRGQLGELRGRQVRVSHLREAMPFDTIEVRAYVAEVMARGVSLNFEYFKVNGDGNREKIATGSYLGAWFARTADENWVCTDLPATLSAGLRPAESTVNRMAAAPVG